MQFEFQNIEESTNFFNRKQTLKQKISSLLAEKKYGYYYHEFFEEIRKKKSLRKMKNR